MELGLVGSMFEIALILELVGSLGTILLRAFRLVSARRALCVSASLAIAAIHTTSYIGLFGAAFAAGDAHQPIPLASRLALPVLGTPLMYLLRLPPSIFAPAGRWWGDDSNFIIGLAILNGLLWGFALGWLVARSRLRFLSVFAGSGT